jgi:hypothetical protein
VVDRALLTRSRALSEERALVTTTLNRGTLHLVRREGSAWLHALTAPTVEAPRHAVGSP